jgi:hypothetical protein
MSKRLSISLAVTLCLVATTAFAQICIDIHGPGTDGCSPSPLAGNEVTIGGIVTVVPGTYNNGAVYFQCAGGGGMTLYDEALAGVVGLMDEVTVTGTVDAYYDEIQLINTTVIVDCAGCGVVVPTCIGTGALAAGTDKLGSLMTVQGLLAKVSIGFNSTYVVDDGTGPVTVFVDGTTGIDTAIMDQWLGDIVAVTGVTKCYNGEGEILPRFDDDIKLCIVPTDDASWGALKAQY